MGAGKSTGARALAAELGTRGARLRPRARAPRWASRSSRSSTARARPPSARARRSSCCELLGARGRAAWSRSAAARSAPSACARRSRAHTVVHLEVEPEEAWRRASGKGRPLARDRGRFEAAARATARRCYESVADAVAPARPTATSLRRALPALVALRARARGPARGSCGRRRRRATTRSSWAAGLLAARLLLPARRAGASW